MKVILYFLFYFINTVSFGFNFDKTLDLLYLAQSAYCPDVTKDNWSCKYCENNVVLEKVIDHEGVRVLLGYHEKYDSLFVAFRGSENIENWLQNIKIEFTYPYDIPNNDIIKWKDIGIEKGFYNIYQFVQSRIIDTLDIISDKYDTRNVMSTGHSLGSVSTLLTFELYYFYPRYVTNSDITFGSPRMGNQEFVNAFKKIDVDSFRITHYYDIVPHLPEEFMGYVHVPGEIWFNKNNTDYMICDDLVKEDDMCSNSCGIYHCNSIEDHLNYIGISMGSNGDC